MLNTIRLTFTAALVALLAACGTAPKRSPYYQKDGPPSAVPADIEAIPDATPQVESLRPANARPYTVLGRSYVPMTSLREYRERGIASWYGRQFHGEKTASGETYDMFAMTAAHKTLPIPSYARVTNPRTGRQVIVRINDRGPFHDGRIIDLSYAAAVRLAGRNVGTQEVEVELLLPDEIARLRREGDSTNIAQTRVQPQPVTPTTPPESSPNDAVVVTPVASVAPTPGIAVQAGAFAQRANAEALRERLVRERPAWNGRVGIVDAASRFRVQLGPYLDRAEALADLALLKEILGLDGLLVDAR
ncbi:MAG TPA: septal ring lytic transglycosylase RlpA family protein [Burkholderiaceae bacterium]|nr:septal ring lytic transglycosylase RlpA family protein [Burkholderiaceae bacterium]